MIRSTLGFAMALFAGVAFSQQPIRTGIDATFAPHAMPKAGGGLEGFNIDLANDLARRMGRPITIDGTEFSALIPALNAKKYDFLIAPTTVTPERAKALLFTEGYMETDYMFLQKKSDKDIRSTDDLKGKTISVNKGSAYESWAKDNAPKFGFKYDVYGTNADAVQAVLSGRADANMAGHTVILWAAKQNPAVKATYTYKTGLVWAMPFRHDDKAGRDQVNMVLKCMKMDGTVARLYEKWFGVKPAADSWVHKVAPGMGVPGMEGYDPTPVKPKCS
ncbi:MAG TPA: transporter substrate-binding domain-containing protein [Burkholderiales bacterium]|jgi:polar amino acid transport system substrate-binding protein|nr:transporter substrate-binding domain-containing protein [Burkholderiales bacterium]